MFTNVMHLFVEEYQNFAVILLLLIPKLSALKCFGFTHILCDAKSTGIRRIARTTTQFY